MKAITRKKQLTFIPRFDVLNVAVVILDASISDESGVGDRRRKRGFD